MTKWLVLLIVAAIGAYWVSQNLAMFDPECRMKGNISREAGKKIYHMPGGAYYGATVIDPLRGEKWFCSEAEARAAGWRRSRL
jgi:hypothetical protein